MNDDELIEFLQKELETCKHTYDVDEDTFRAGKRYIINTLANKLNLEVWELRDMETGGMRLTLQAKD